MNEHIAIFVKGSHLIETAPEIMLEKKGVDPASFNVYGFKDALQSYVKKLVPNARILRIYWYEQACEEDEEELSRRKSMSRNGIKMRTFPYEDTDIDQELTDAAIEEARLLVDNQAVSDLLFIDNRMNSLVALEDIQAKGIHLHILDLGENSEDETLDIRASADTYSSWRIEELSRFMLDTYTGADHERALRLIEALSEEEDYAPSQDSLVSYSAQPDDEEFVEKSEEMEIESPRLEAAGPVSMPRFDDEDEVNEKADLEDFVYGYVANMPGDQIGYCLSRWEKGIRDVPVLHDRNVLAICRRQLDRNLTPDERVDMRALFHEAVTARSGEADIPPVESFRHMTNNAPEPAFTYSLPRKRSEPDMENNYSFRAAPPPASSMAPRMDFDSAEDIPHEDITEYVELFISGLGDEDLQNCIEYWDQGQIGVPSDFDKGTMALCRQELRRTLGEQEKFFMRKEFKRITHEVAQERGILQ